MSDPIMAATPWPENGDLIADVHALGYLRDDDHVLDPTHERGIWWKRWRPEKLTTHHRAIDGTDFRDLPHPDGTFDAIAYDPPYVCPGGRKTSTVQDMHDRFGMNEGGAADPDFRTPAELQQLINDGLTEMWRLVRASAVLTLDPVRPNGVVVVKCKDYIWSGRLFPGTHHTLVHALALGFLLEDRLEHLSGTGPQPKTNPDGSERGQFHARRNLSTLLVLRKPPQRAADATLDFDALRRGVEHVDGGELL